MVEAALLQVIRPVPLIQRIEGGEIQPGLDVGDKGHATGNAGHEPAEGIPAVAVCPVTGPRGGQPVGEHGHATDGAEDLIGLRVEAPGSGLGLVLVAVKANSWRYRVWGCGNHLPLAVDHDAARRLANLGRLREVEGVLPEDELLDVVGQRVGPALDQHASGAGVEVRGADGDTALAAGQGETVALNLVSGQQARVRRGLFIAERVQALLLAPVAARREDLEFVHPVLVLARQFELPFFFTLVVVFDQDGLVVLVQHHAACHHPPMMTNDVAHPVSHSLAGDQHQQQRADQPAPCPGFA